MPLITTNLKAQFETTNTVVSPTSWIDEVAGIELTQIGSMADPALVAGGTPTGASYFAFDSANDGLGTADLAGADIPDGVEPRTMYVVVRFPTGSTAGNFHGVMYGTANTRQAFGMVMSNTEKVLTDFWAASFASTASFNDNTWHVIAITFDGSGVVGYVDNAGVISGTPATLNTVLSRLYINYKINNSAGALMDCAAVLLYAGTHSPEQLTEMNAYLRGKYIEASLSDEVGGGTLASGAPAISGGAVGQTHQIGVATLSTASPAISGGNPGQTHQLGGATVSAGLPALTGASVGQTHRLGGSSLTSGSPTITGGAVEPIDQVGGATVSTGAPSITAGDLGQSHRIAGASVSTGSPTISGGSLDNVSSIGGATITAGAPAVTGGGVGQLHVIAGTDLTGGTPVPSGGAIAQLHLIAGTDLQAGAPVISGGDAAQGVVVPVVVALFRDTAIWDEPRVTATWDEPRLEAVWDEPRFTALWRQ
uniref:hypothetical protein n=1 Tax=Roseovarius sp. BRH_c41 TaxID=1629709 RepID=UPI000AE99AE6|nr:hypothetical protein [Roseovarius sp. BRH_c41]